MSEVPQTDVSRPAALFTARLNNRTANARPVIEQNSTEYLDAVEEEWNRKVDVEVETLVDGMVDLVGLASVRIINSLYGIAYLKDFLSSRLVIKTNSELLKKHFKPNQEPNLWFEFSRCPHLPTTDIHAFGYRLKQPTHCSP
jgi:hypothetical protein